MTRQSFEQVMSAVVGLPCAALSEARWQAIERTHEDWRAMRSLSGGVHALEDFCRFLLTEMGRNVLERRMLAAPPAEVRV